MNGIINIYKEQGYTSHDVVAKARGILQIKKIGHTGTLDPQAEGVLPICIGKATKASELLMNQDKRYVATVSLGIATTTEDAWGEIIETKQVSVTKEKIQEAVNSFLGPSMQIPPMYSALKVKGKKLYELARQGLVIERKSRPITIYDCQITEYISPKEFIIDVKCSKGTYIRTLCADIGKYLGCGAHMKALVRTKVGDFDIANSITLSQLERLKETENIQPYLVEIDQLFLHLPKLNVTANNNKYLYNGNRLQKTMFIQQIDEKHHDKVRIYDEDNVFIGVYRMEKLENNIYFIPENIFFSQ